MKAHGAVPTVLDLFVCNSTRMSEVNSGWSALHSEAAGTEYPTSSCTGVAGPAAARMDTHSTLLDPRQPEQSGFSWFFGGVHYRIVDREILLNLFGISYTCKCYYKPSPLSSTAYTSVLPCEILTAATSFFYPISARRHHYYHNLSTSTCRSPHLQRLWHSRLRL